MFCFLLLAAATVHIDTEHALNTFDPREALGAGVDGHEHGQIAKMLRPANVRAMLSAGLTTLSYRLRTELAGEAWHWNPEGAWSDRKHRQGYWVSSTRASKPIRLSYGYKLPRRGNTHDQANDDGYSRLDDGDPRSFWKSNPYLDRYYTGEDNAAHPAWVVIDLGAPAEVDTIRLLWGEPFATRFSVEYTEGAEIDITQTGIWRPFPSAASLEGTGSDQTVRLAGTPLSTRYVRVLMTAFSGTAPPGASDPRDKLGVAVREIYLGKSDASGALTDLLRHRKDNRQTAVYVSSTDAWHRASDRDPNIEQPGFDLLFRGGLTRSLPVLMAVPVLYDVPENAANEIRFLAARHYPVTHAELGEEPEEQWIAPEDYGALYAQWARALHGAAPSLDVGGTSLVLLHADADPEPSWTKRLFAWLRDRRPSERLSFFSFEWYPFDDVCDPAAPQLAESDALLAAALDRLRRDGLHRETPAFMTEYGYSAYGTRAEVDIEGALLNLESAAQFLSLGGARAYLYGYEPNQLINEKGCTWGNNMLFGMTESGAIAYRTATYWASRLLTQEWADPNGGAHQLYAVEAGMPLLSAFAVRRPDGQVAVLAIHKDPQNTVSVRIPQFSGAIDVYQYSRAQYEWKENREDGHPARNLPPEHRVADAAAAIDLPPYSLTVVRGRLH